jgi:predicted transcriptional regulator
MMAKEPPQDHDEHLVQSAALRASIVGWLQSNPGPHKITEIAEGLGSDRNPVRHVCKDLAATGLIEQAGGGGRGQVLSYSSVGQEILTPKKTRVVKGRLTKDVELVVAGVEIVIGRNPATGRLRITLEG